MFYRALIILGFLSGIQLYSPYCRAATGSQGEDPRKVWIDSFAGLVTAEETNAEGSAYILTKSLGSGKEGQVFLAQRSSQNGAQKAREVALKFINLANFSPLVRQNIEAGLAVLPTIARHPFLIFHQQQLQSKNKQVIGLVMDFASQGDLFDFLVVLSKNKNYLTEREICRFLCQILFGLHYLHDHLQLIHRDLKVENILLGPAYGQVKIGDFGFVTSLPASAEMIVGTPRYLPPEVVPRYGMKQSKSQTKEGDMYALGIIAYFLTCMRPPVELDRDNRLVLVNPERLARGEWKKELYRQESAPPLSREFRAFVAQCLETSPTVRPSAFSALNTPLLVFFAADLLQQSTTLAAAGVPEQENVEIQATIKNFFRERIAMQTPLNKMEEGYFSILLTCFKDYHYQDGKLSLTADEHHDGQAILTFEVEEFTLSLSPEDIIMAMQVPAAYAPERREHCLTLILAPLAQDEALFCCQSQEQADHLLKLLLRVLRTNQK